MSDGPRFGPMEPGLAYPLGARCTPDGVNFAVFSANATRIELCLFDEGGNEELARLELPELTDEVWHGHLPGASAGTVYGYRAHGPYAPEEGHRFNAHKLLLDPYAVELVGRIKWEAPLCAYDTHAKKAGTGFDKRDSAACMLKARVPGPWGKDPERPPMGLRVPWDRSLIYEAHVRGLTRLHPEVPGAQRGTFAGLGAPAVIAHLKDLGVSSIELLPVHAFVGDAWLADKGLRNYWGYNTIAFFSPEPSYCSGPAIDEFRETVARLHDAGIEVILDVVYNHTAEGNEFGPTLSFKGLDNASYYRLDPGHRAHYINDSGTGNTLNASHPRVLQMVMDSLRHWVGRMGVDGFRFDLATILGREDDGFDPGCGFFDACRQDPVLNRVKLIAEPWDCGPGGYQPGNFPPGWAEWNDAFRDTVRSFWRGDEGQAPELATRLAGSADRFGTGGRRPWASINFVTAHDGFTLEDLVSYDAKHNEANGEDNRDGHDDNRSWNCGVEGPSADPGVRALRRRQKRNLLATLLLGRGTPMLLAGDEIARTQQGNNNAYCQDNELSWLDWSGIDEAARAQLAFVRRVVAIRDALPVLRPAGFATGLDSEDGLRDVVWLAPDGTALGPGDWDGPQLRAFGMLADGRAHPEGEHEAAAEAIVFVVLNAAADALDWTLPAPPGAGRWTRLLDTGADGAREVEHFAPADRLVVGARSLQLFVAAPDEVTAAGIEALLQRLAEEG